MKESRVQHIVSPAVEGGLWLFACAFTVLGIIFSMFTIGPIGGKGPASHAMAGIAELAIAIGVIVLTVTIIITRLIYRAWSLRWLRIAAIIYLILIALSLSLGFIDVLVGALGVAISLIAGLAVSLLLGVAYFVRRLRT
jgi:hypothetical protein